MLFDFSGKVAIVTGGNGGIGLGMAKGLAQAGASIVVAARNPEKSAQAVEELAALGAQAVAVGVDVASKGGIVQLARALATAWAKDNIQVNAVLPGWIDTKLTVRGRRDVPGLQERVEARTPAGRWGVPDDFRGIAAFLASPASDFLTGAAIPVDGVPSGTRSSGSPYQNRMGLIAVHFA